MKICNVISANGGSKIYKEEVRDRLVDPLATNFKSANVDWKTGANS